MTGRGLKIPPTMEFSENLRLESNLVHSDGADQSHKKYCSGLFPVNLFRFLIHIIEMYSAGRADWQKYRQLLRASHRRDRSFHTQKIYRPYSV